MNQSVLTLTRIFKEGSASARRPAVTQAAAPPDRIVKHNNSSDREVTRTSYKNDIINCIAVVCWWHWELHSKENLNREPQTLYISILRRIWNRMQRAPRIVNHYFTCFIPSGHPISLPTIAEYWRYTRGDIFMTWWNRLVFKAVLKNHITNCEALGTNPKIKIVVGDLKGRLKISRLGEPLNKKLVRF